MQDSIEFASTVAIYARDVGFSYPGGDLLFGAVSFSAGAGDVVCLVGPPMSGKTTMCRLIGGYLHPTVGELVVTGEVVTAIGLGMGPGDFTTLSEFARYKALEFNVSELRPDEVLETCRLTAMADLQIRQVGPAIRQRVALAVLLQRGSKVVVLDTSPAGRDSDTSHIIRPLIRTFLGEGGILVYTSRKAPATRVANTIVRISN